MDEHVPALPVPTKPWPSLEARLQLVLVPLGADEAKRLLALMDTIEPGAGPSHRSHPPSPEKRSTWTLGHTGRRWQDGRTPASGMGASSPTS